MKAPKNKKTLKFSKLDYAVMAILHNCQLSGYDITNRLKHFWKTSHSRIYPTLAKLESFGLLKHEEVRQQDRPDKKVYRLTPNALEELKAWVLDAEDGSFKSVHDEKLLKLLCCDIISKEDLLELAKKRMATTMNAQENFQKMVKDITLQKNDSSTEFIEEIIACASMCDTHIYNWMLENAENNSTRESLRDYIKRKW